VIELSEEVIYSKQRGTITFQVISKPGSRNYNFDKEKKDRLFFLRLKKGNQSFDWAYSYKEQQILFGVVLDNIILGYVFEKELKDFMIFFDVLKRKRKTGEKVTSFESLRLEFEKEKQKGLNEYGK